MKYDRNLELDRTISFRTQPFFYELTHIFSKYVLNTSYSSVARVIYEVGTIQILSEFLYFSSQERQILASGEYAQNYFNELCYSSRELIIHVNEIFRYFFPFEKYKVKLFWQLTYEILQELLEFLFFRFGNSLLRIVSDDTVSVALSRDIMNKIFARYEAVDRSLKEITQKILFSKKVETSSFLKKLLNRKGSSVESLKLWLAMIFAAIIRINFEISKIEQTEERELLKRKFLQILKDKEMEVKKVLQTFEKMA